MLLKFLHKTPGHVIRLDALATSTVEAPIAPAAMRVVASVHDPTSINASSVAMPKCVEYVSRPGSMVMQSVFVPVLVQLGLTANFNP